MSWYHQSIVGQNVGTAKAFQKLLENKFDLLKPLLELMSEEKRNRLFSNQDYIEKIVCLTKKYTLMSSEDYTQELPQTALFNQMEEYSEAFQRCDSTTKRRLARQVTEVVNEVTPGYFAKDKKTRGNQMLDMFHATIPYTKKTNQQVYSMTGSDIASIATSLQSENMPGINPAIS